MNEALATIKKLINECSADDLAALKHYLRLVAPHALETEWKIDSDTILSAISRSSDITKRGMRGIIAEAVFESSTLPRLRSAGWHTVTIVGDLSYDVYLTKSSASIRIQIKLQRLDKGEPFLYYPKHYEENSLYVVEVQKTRTGKKKTKKLKVKDGDQDVVLEAPAPPSIETRPYSFSDFDILAVNMHPSSGDWKQFRYTVASWLLPRKKDGALIEVMQPVAATPNSVWTSDLVECIEWFQSGEKRKVLTELLHVRKLKDKKIKRPSRRIRKSKPTSSANF